MTTATTLPYTTELGFAALGVALSVLIPFLAAIVARYWPSNSSFTTWSDIIGALRPYIALGLFSVVVGALVAAAADFTSKETALLAGFAWDKTLQVSRGITVGWRL